MLWHILYSLLRLLAQKVKNRLFSDALVFIEKVKIVLFWNFAYYHRIVFFSLLEWFRFGKLSRVSEQIQIQWNALRKMYPIQLKVTFNFNAFLFEYWMANLISNISFLWKSQLFLGSFKESLCLDRGLFFTKSQSDALLWTARIGGNTDIVFISWLLQTWSERVIDACCNYVKVRKFTLLNDHYFFFKSIKRLKCQNGI